MPLLRTVVLLLLCPLSGFAQTKYNPYDPDEGAPMPTHRLEHSDEGACLYDKDDLLLLCAAQIERVVTVQYYVDEYGDIFEYEHAAPNVYQVTDHHGTYLISLFYGTVVTPVCPAGTIFEILPDNDEGDLITFEIDGEIGIYHTNQSRSTEVKYTKVEPRHYFGPELFATANEQGIPRWYLLNPTNPNEVLLSGSSIGYPTSLPEEFIDYEDFGPINPPQTTDPEAPGYVYMEYTKLGIYSPIREITTAAIYDSVFYYTPTLLGTVKDGKYGCFDLMTGVEIPAEFPNVPEIMTIPTMYPEYFGYVPEVNELIGVDGRRYPLTIYAIGACQPDEQHWNICQYNDSNYIIASYPLPGATYVEEPAYPLTISVVQYDQLFGLVNAFGENILDPVYKEIMTVDYVSDFLPYLRYGFELRSVKNKTGIYLPEPELMIEPHYDFLELLINYVGDKHLGWIVTDKKKTGLLHPDGVVKIPLEYVSVYELEHEAAGDIYLVGLTKKGQYDIFDNAGRKLFPEACTNVNLFDITDRNGNLQTLIIGETKKQRLVRHADYETIFILGKENFAFDELHYLMASFPILPDQEKDKYGLRSFQNEVIFPFEYDAFFEVDEYSHSITPVLVGEKDGKLFSRGYDLLSNSWLPMQVAPGGYDFLDAGKGVQQAADGTTRYFDLLTGKETSAP